MTAREIFDHTYKALTCCCDPIKDCITECSGRGGKVAQAVLMFISLGVAVFDSYTDWSVWVGLNNYGFGLLQAPDYFLYAWLAFTIMGTLLTVISFSIDVIDLVSGWNICGFNSLNCAEVLSFFNLVLEDLPILTLTCAYVLLRQQICAGFDPTITGDVYLSEYRDLYICGVITCAAIIYRTVRSFYRLCYSHGCCCCEAPDASQKLCPQDSCARTCCIIPFALFLCVLVKLSMTAVTIGIAITYIMSTIGAFSGRIPSAITTNWTITHSPPVASNSSTIGDVRLLIEDGHLSVTEAFHTRLDEATYCLAYFEFHSREIVFNVANIDKQHSINEACLCNRDSTPCDHYYENIFIGTLCNRDSDSTLCDRYHENISFGARYSYDVHIISLQDMIQHNSCLLPVKPLRRDRELQVNCNCSFPATVEHLVLG